MGKRRYTMNPRTLGRFVKRDGMVICQCCKKEIKVGDKVVSNQITNGDRQLRHRKCIVRY